MWADLSIVIQINLFCSIFSVNKIIIMGPEINFLSCFYLNKKKIIYCEIHFEKMYILWMCCVGVFKINLFRKRFHNILYKISNWEMSFATILEFKLFFQFFWTVWLFVRLLIKIFTIILIYAWIHEWFHDQLSLNWPVFNTI